MMGVLLACTWLLSEGVGCSFLLHVLGVPIGTTVLINCSNTTV